MQPRSGLPDLHAHSESLDQPRERVAQPDARAGRDVHDLADGVRHSDERKVGMDHVVDVDEIPDTFQIPGIEDSRPLTSLYPPELSPHPRNPQYRSLPSPA